MADGMKLSRESLFAALRMRGAIFAPDGSGRWARHEAESLPELGPIRPRRPLKDLFSPPTRQIASWAAGAGPADIQPAPLDATPGSVFGVRPCDARALKLLDRVYLAQPHVDPHYQARRESLLLVGVACEPGPVCYCGVFGFGPDDGGAVDVMLWPQADGFVASAASVRGQAFLTTVAGAVAAPLPTPRPGPKPTWWTELPDAKRLYGSFEHPVWKELATSCMSCGVCTLYCPTCQCFNVVDESYKGETQRLRIMDSCQRKDFTRMAGGHDPRVVAASRLRQRVLHKFAYIPMQSRGEPAGLAGCAPSREGLGTLPGSPSQSSLVGCTGCGRCVELCPLDRNLFAELVEILKRLDREAERVA